MAVQGNVFDMRRIMELIENEESFPVTVDIAIEEHTWSTKKIEPRLQKAPPIGLECCQYLYDSHGDVDTNLVLRKAYEIILEEKCSFQLLPPGGKPSASVRVVIDGSSSSDIADTMIIALLESVRLFEEEGMFSPEVCQKLKKLLICLNQIYHNQIPEEFDLGSSIVSLLGLKWEDAPNYHGSFLIGNKKTNAFYLIMIYVINQCLGLYQIFSKNFALELINCFSNFHKAHLELASGRAMLSAAFKSAGLEAVFATDKVVPAQTFADFTVTKCNANKLLEGYSGKKPIYFISEPPGRLMDELCTTALQQGEPIMVVTIGYLFRKVLQKHTQNLVVIELTIPDYVELKLYHGVQLLLFNHNREQVQACREKVPRQYFQFQPTANIKTSKP